MRIAFTHNLRFGSSEDDAEFDSPETIARLSAALTRLGHDVHLVEVSGPASRLVARLESLRPDMVFNNAEGTWGRYREAFYPALFEQLRLPFTGSDAYVCAVTLDKQATKMLVAARGVPTPRWAFIDATMPWAMPELTFPVIVKPNFEGSSKGVTVDSVVERSRDLEPRVRELLERYPDGLLIEEFIIGRDVTVPYIEGAAPDWGGVLMPAAYRFDKKATAGRRYEIYDYSLKNVLGGMVAVEVPAQIPPSALHAVRRHTATVMKLLGVRDVGRADFRVTDDGDVYFIEVNAIPSLEPGAPIYDAAALVGLPSMDSLLDHIIRNASERHGISPDAPGARPESLRVGLAYNLKRIDPKKGEDGEAEYDAPATIAAIRGAIEQLGHEVIELEATPELMAILPATDVDIVFNIAEGIGGRNREAQVPAMLELLGVHYTGSDPTTLAISLDKALAKRLVAQAGVPTPPFFLMRTGDEALPIGTSFPLIVKPNAEGSSKGVVSASVVHDEAQLRELAHRLCGKYRQPVLVEAFLPGREFTVGLLGEIEPRVLPPMEVVFSPKAGDHPVYTFGDKLEPDQGVRYEVPAKIDADLADEICSVAIASFEALGCRDVARVDLRLDGEGRVNFIEVNPLPGLTPGWSDLCLIAEGAGMDYVNLIAEIMAPAIRRLHAERVGGGR